MTEDGGSLGIASRLAVGSVDEALLARAARGEPEAFDAVIRPRLDRLFRMAVAITRSDADARDAVQEACVLAWRELPRLRDRSRFDAWLSQILVNACRGLLRKQRRLPVREVDVDDAGATTPAAYATASGADERAEAELIRRAFDRLDGDTRSLHVLN